MKIKRILGICECPGCLRRAEVGIKLFNKNTKEIKYAAVCNECVWKLYEEVRI